MFIIASSYKYIYARPGGNVGVEIFIHVTQSSALARCGGNGQKTSPDSA